MRLREQTLPTNREDFGALILTDSGGITPSIHHSDSSLRGCSVGVILNHVIIPAVCIDEGL